jgi:hypothetical protein
VISGDTNIPLGVTFYQWHIAASLVPTVNHRIVAALWDLGAVEVLESCISLRIKGYTFWRLFLELGLGHVQTMAMLTHFEIYKWLMSKPEAWR